jgi:hypothetical protein
MLFDYCLFYWGRFIPSHGEVLCFYIAWVEWDEESTQGEEDIEEECIVCKYCVFAPLAENGQRKSKGDRIKGRSWIRSSP